MLGPTYRLPFRLLGIPVLLDLSFLIVLPFLAWIIGTDLKAYIQWFGLAVDANSLPAGATPYLLGLSAALGLFGSVLIHELGHAVVGRRYGVRVQNITLWILGGMAQFERMPRQSGAEAIVAIAGPVTSFILGFLCWLGLKTTSGQPVEVQFVLAYLMTMNVILASFNLLPALPLDGGRVLRSLLAIRSPYLKATQLSASLSKSMAFLLGLVGFLWVNPFLMLIALFVYMGASSEARQATYTEVFQGFQVKDLMTRAVKVVPRNFLVSELVQKMLKDHHLGYPVVDERGKILGVVGLSDVQRFRQARGEDSETTVEQILTTRQVTVGEKTTALQAFQRMSRRNFGRLVVLDSSGNMSGILSKTDLMRAIQIRMADLGE